MVRNVHQRVLPLSPSEAGALLDGVASSEGGLWPTDRWPSMRLDRGLGVGASGGHGPIRYEVSDYEPGRRVTFRFSPGFPVAGHHWFEVFTRDGQTVMRHEVEARPRGLMRLGWPLAVRWLHDALVEDALDRAAGARQRAHSPWVRLLRAVSGRGGRTPGRRPPRRTHAEAE